jgi:rubredoxin
MHAFTGIPSVLPRARHARAAVSLHPSRAARAAPLRMQSEPPAELSVAERRAAKFEAEKKRLEADGYWPGELICADCGFVYDNVKRKQKFEDMPADWTCPQCQAPKRRFARKVGDFVESTAATSNTPIIIFSVGGLILTLLFGYWAASSL